MPHLTMNIMCIVVMTLCNQLEAFASDLSDEHLRYLFPFCYLLKSLIFFPCIDNFFRCFSFGLLMSQLAKQCLLPKLHHMLGPIRLLTDDLKQFVGSAV